MRAAFALGGLLVVAGIAVILYFAVFKHASTAPAPPTLTPASQISSQAECYAHGSNNYNYCPATGVHYCCGVCTGSSDCKSKHNVEGCACQSAPPAPPQKGITSQDLCDQYGNGNYNYDPVTGVHYCCGYCTGTSQSMSNQGDKSCACNPIPADTLWKYFASTKALSLDPWDPSPSAAERCNWVGGQHNYNGCGGGTYCCGAPGCNGAKSCNGGHVDGCYCGPTSETIN